MRTINDKVEGAARIEQDTELRGMIVGATVVAAGVSLLLNGMIIGPLTLEEGAKVRLNGMVTGDVINKGGGLEIYGTVSGAVIRRGGMTAVHPNARIGSVVDQS